MKSKGWGYIQLNTVRSRANNIMLRYYQIIMHFLLAHSFREILCQVSIF